MLVFPSPQLNAAQSPRKQPQRGGGGGTTIRNEETKRRCGMPRRRKHDTREEDANRGRPPHPAVGLSRRQCKGGPGERMRAVWEPRQTTRAKEKRARGTRACGDYVPLIYGPPPPSLWQSFLCADTTRAAAMRNRHKLASCARLEVFGNEVPQRRATADVNHVSKPRARSPPYKQEKRQLRGARRFVVSQ